MVIERKTILIVDDSKPVLSLLSRKINDVLDVRILKATNFKEALKFILEEEIIHVAILDLALPDAPNGEIVDYAISKNIPSVVLTATFDEKLKETIIEKDIIDYIIKDSPSSVANVVNSISRTLKNYDTNVMIVEDSPVQLALAVEQLERMKLNVSTATNGKEALELIEKGNIKYSLILTDYNMPVMDGMELVFKLREDYKKNQLGIVVLSANNVPKIATDFIKIGANDFINKPYSQVEFQTRINSNLNLINLFEEVQEEQRKQHEEDLVKSAKFLTIGQMAAGITHEINTPLTYIKGTTEMSRHDIENISDIEIKQRLLDDNKKVMDGIDRMGIIIESMREMSQVTPTVREEQNIYSTLITVLRMIYNRSKQVAKIHINDELFDLEISDKDKYKFLASIHKQKIEQVWTIILNNALDELIKIDNYENRRIDISLFKYNNKIIVEFQDNAGGIPEDIREKVFEPFVSTKESSGIGIGLNVAKKIIEEHNATIEAINRDSGACFVIELESL